MRLTFKVPSLSPRRMARETTEADDDIDRRFAEAVKIEVRLNRDEVTFPMALFNPRSDGKVTWIADRSRTDPSLYIMVLSYDLKGPLEEKTISEVNLETALLTRKTLVDDGWLKLVPPEVTINAPGGKRPLNRKEKRWLSRQVASMDKKNPFRHAAGGAGDGSTASTEADGVGSDGASESSTASTSAGGVTSTEAGTSTS